MYDIILTGRIKGDPLYKLHFAQSVVKMKTWRPQASIWNPAILPEGREYGWYIRQCVHALMDKAAPGCILVRRKGWNKGFGSVALWALARCIGMPVLDEWKL